MKVFKIGVIGLGDISNVYLTNLKKYDTVVELYACACRTPEKAAEKCKHYGFTKSYATGDELIADPDIDIILNLTTPAAHYKYNLAAIKAGKHVYTEKPLANTFAEGQEIMALAKEKGLYVGSAPDTFMGSRVQTIRRMIDEGETGSIIGGIVNCVSHGWEWFHPNPDFFYQPGAGPVHDIGPYYWTALLALLGPVDSVTAMASTPITERTIYSQPLKGQTIKVDLEVLTHVMAVLKFKNGAIVSANMSWNVWDSKLPKMELYGTKATIVMEDQDPNDGPNLFGGVTLMKNVDNYRWKSMPRVQEEMDQPWTEVEVKHGHTSVSQAVNSRGIGLVDMAESIREGKTSRANGDMALHMLEVADGILISAREGRVVTLNTTFTVPEAMPQK
ncbi:MAG: Gfo/Idh/MocA family oxidoreductase [Lachnospiraceae bacterium]|nr:Gfo/Idh/MocA family oxidoreductase [Lachnospiraceae bacterium]